MQKVAGVNAVMVYAQSPDRLAAWYRTHLGIVTELNTADGCYYGDIAPGFHFGIYPAVDGNGGTRRGSVMVNYRVGDFGEFLRHLESHGAAIDETREEPYGLFAYLKDCEGNPVEIWAEKEPMPAI